MAKPNEVWKLIPEIDGMAFASNLGHLMGVTAGPAKEHGGEMRIIMRDVSEHLMLNPRTKELGWAFARPDGSINFVSRDSLIRRFEGIPVEIDRTYDESARTNLTVLDA